MCSICQEDRSLGHILQALKIGKLLAAHSNEKWNNIQGKKKRNLRIYLLNVNKLTRNSGSVHIY